MNEDILSLTQYEHKFLGAQQRKPVLPQLGRDGFPLIHVWACRSKHIYSTSQTHLVHLPRTLKPTGKVK